MQAARLQGEEEEEAVYKTKGTLSLINWSRLPIHPADQQQRWGVREGLKVKEEAFKVDASHISHNTKESQRSAIWTRHIICSGITKRKSNHSQ